MNKISIKKQPVKYWLREIDKEKQAHKKYRKEAKKSEKAARDDGDLKHDFNIHWANCKIVKSAVYASRPKPDVRRRYQKPDPEEKELARLVERAIEYNLDVNGFDSPANAVAQDFVRSALGVPRVIYDVDTLPLQDEVEGDLQRTEPTFNQGLEEIAGQRVGIEHVSGANFGWQPGHNQWSDVNWAYIKTYTNAEEILADYNRKVKSGDVEKEDREASKYKNEIIKYEVFDKKRRKVWVIVEGEEKPLDEYDDKLNLQGFYPFPRPAFDNLKSDELIPKPDYSFIEKNIVELNRLTQRRSALVKHVKSVRLYDAKIADALQQLEDSVDGANIPVTNLLEMLESSGGTASMNAVIADLPMADRVAVIRELDVQVESVKNQIYEVIGISDIIRGASKASETATAQSIKGQWANVRLNEKTSEINRMWRDVLRMMAEIICEHFEPAQLTMMTGIEITDRMVKMMKSDIGRSFAIDVESDSTIVKDDLEEKQQKLELVNVLLEKLGYVLPLIQQGIMPVEIVQEILLFIVSSHKHGKQLEDAVNGLGEQMGNLQNLQQLQQQLQQAQGQLQQSQGQLQQSQHALQQFDEREELRKDNESEARAAKDHALGVAAEIEAIGADLDDAEQSADIDKTRAETHKIKSDILMGEVMKPRAVT